MLIRAQLSPQRSATLAGAGSAAALCLQPWRGHMEAGLLAVWHVKEQNKLQVLNTSSVVCVWEGAENGGQDGTRG